MKFARTFLFTSLLILLAASAFAAGYLFRMEKEASASFPLLVEAYDLLQEHGLKDLPPEPVLEYGMIRGMLQAYNDPYTLFVEPPQHELEGNALEGRFGGVGIELNQDAQGFWVIFPYPDGPAARAGVQEGDRLVAVDDLQVLAGTALDAIQSAVRGPVGSQVSLRVARQPDYQVQEISMRRAEFPLPSVTARQDPDQPQVGIVDVNLIAASTAEEILQAVEDLQARGAAFFVIDLRDNPGGLLTAGVEVARLFLTEGMVIEQQYRDQKVESFQVEEPGPLAEIPLMVLINSGSASAAEIVAGALQAHGRASLVGVPSMGKDTIQLVFDLKDKSSLHVTAARWWVPGLDQPLSGEGLQPDILVNAATDPAVRDETLQEALRLLLNESQ